MTRVKCTVDTCQYWGQGQVCAADEIEVNSNYGGTGAGRTAFADELSTAGQSAARTSAETMCQTYRPRNSRAGR